MRFHQQHTQKAHIPPQHGNATGEVIFMPKPRKTPDGKARREGPTPSAKNEAPWFPMIFPVGSVPMTPPSYPVYGTDLGRDNLENDLPDADLQDLDF